MAQVFGKLVCSRPNKTHNRSQRDALFVDLGEPCDVHYVGETGRAFQTRKKEHMSSVRLRKAQTSALAEHSTKHGHDIDWENTKIVTKESKWTQRRWREAWEIAKSSTAIANRDMGRTLPQSYIPVLKKYS